MRIDKTNAAIVDEIVTALSLPAATMTVPAVTAVPAVQPRKGLP